MRCPNCGDRDSRVVDSRDLEDAGTVRRRRECVACATRFTTYERVETARLTIVKRSGRREEFDRGKLVSGLQKSLIGRPVRPGAAEAAADAVEARLRAVGRSEISADSIGELVMRELRGLDDLAYIRFASHYQNFEDIEQLKQEVDTLIAERTSPVGTSGDGLGRRKGS